MSEINGGENQTFQVNPSYALGQLAKALTTSEQHEDAATRERARKRVELWLQVFEGVVNGRVDVGSRTPVSGAPAWATLEVVTGGFATGELLAGGDILPHEREMLDQLSATRQGAGRQTLNAYFVTEEGVAKLQEMLTSGRYEINVPEEGALLVAAWLLGNGHSESARELLEEIGPFFGKLRFYPVPTDQPRRYGSRVCLQDVAATINNLNAVSPNIRILAQKEAIEIWTPLYDRTVALFLETVEGEPPSLLTQGESSPNVTGGWPCGTYPDGWQAKATALLNEFETQRKVHQLCGKPDRKKENFPQLRAWMRRCIDNPSSLNERDVARIRLLLARYVSRRGMPQSAPCTDLRKRQAKQVGGPTHHELSKVVVSRLEQHPSNTGIEVLDSVLQPVTSQEGEHFRIEEEEAIPKSVRQKVERCMIETADVLIERGIIKSGDTLARVLPQVTSGLRAAGIADPTLRQLYASIYRAFRRRRSLLLLNLESQVKIEELPWVAAIDQFRRDDLSARELAKGTLQELTALTVLSFPHAIIPNKLLQELRALAKSAYLDLPLVEEVAADIFMGQFSAKFVQAAKRAANLLEGTLYEAYYGIDYAAVRRISEPQRQQRPGWFQQSAGGDALVEYCSSRAGVQYGGWNVVNNGMIIEQEQILTTHNLAVLLDGLDLIPEIRSHLANVAQRCFQWICDRQQANSPTHHATLIMLKNTAYAWRQMIFYLSLLPDPQVREFLTWAEQHLQEQAPDFQSRFRPALDGLNRAAEGGLAKGRPNRQFLGWTKGRHWLLGPEVNR